MGNPAVLPSDEDGPVPVSFRPSPEELSFLQLSISGVFCLFFLNTFNNFFGFSLRLDVLSGFNGEAAEDGKTGSLQAAT